MTASYGAPVYTRAQRLTNTQFEHAVIDILRLPAEADLSSGLVEPARGTTDFSNNEHLLNVDAKTFEGLEEAAEQAASLATGSAEALERVDAGTDAEGFVRTLGRRAFRRPLSDDEITRYVAMFARGEQLYGAGFANGAALVIRAMLQSPSFLYRTELGPAGEPLSDYEVASKLSFLLLDTTPSDALLDAASKGKLSSVEELLEEASAMLEERAAQASMLTFHGELQRIDRFDALEKNGTPDFSPRLAAEAKQASLAFFDRIFAAGEGVRDIMISPRGFVGPLLAPLYGQDAPSELEERDLAPGRLGYFMQAPWLMLHSPNQQPPSLKRGIDIGISLLCLRPPDPPSLLEPIPEALPDQTNRERLSSVLGGCGGECHSRYIDPLGFAFEGFDGLGVARELDRGRPIDASGSFLFTAGEASFIDARDLMLKLAEDDLPYACYGRKLASFGLQRDITPDDAELVGELAAAGRDGSVKETLLALVTSPAFRIRHEDLP